MKYKVNEKCRLEEIVVALGNKSRDSFPRAVAIKRSDHHFKQGFHVRHAANSSSRR